MNGMEENQGQSIYRLRWVGYGLVLFALFDVIQILIPPNFMDPVWELQTIGALVERVPVPLIGLLLIFFGEDFDRTRIEDFLLKFGRWFLLILALIFLGLVPLGIVDTIRINAKNNDQITSLEQKQLNQLSGVETQVNKGTNEEIKSLGADLNRIGIAVDSQKPDELRSKILERLNTAKTQVPQQAKTTRSNQRLLLLKNSVKWNIGALVSSVLYFILWKSTNWTNKLG